MIQEIIKSFPKQLGYQPEIKNQTALEKRGKFIVVGMGGSNLAAGIIKSWKPKLDVIIHRDYGLPDMGEKELAERLIILSSYSGATEETISAFNEALSRKLPLISLATGGKLLELARENSTPHIQLPDIKSHPRFAIGLSVKATLKAMGEESVLNDISGEAESLNADDYEETGRNLARRLGNKIPAVYSSSCNHGLAYFWKINFNETAKIPAFFNTVPELNHNEMVGFSSKLREGGLAPLEADRPEAIVAVPSAGRPLTGLAGKFVFIFLTDLDDEPRIQKRMTATAKILENRGFAVSKADIIGPSPWSKSFASIITSFWTACYLAKQYDVDPEDTSMIEDFKKLIG